MRELLQDFIASLDSLAPLSAPVSISFLPVVKNNGVSWYDDAAQCFVITITPRRDCLDLMVEALKHEWAHCLTECDCTEEHCDHWGAAFARCTRSVTRPCASPD